jgi:hypothetical protein
MKMYWPPTQTLPRRRLNDGLNLGRFKIGKDPQMADTSGRYFHSPAGQVLTGAPDRLPFFELQLHGSLELLPLVRPSILNPHSVKRPVAIYFR